MIICNPRYEAVIRNACKPNTNWLINANFADVAIVFDPNEPDWRLEPDKSGACIAEKDEE